MPYLARDRHGLWLFSEIPEHGRGGFHERGKPDSPGVEIDPARVNLREVEPLPRVGEHVKVRLLMAADE